MRKPPLAFGAGALRSSFLALTVFSNAASAALITFDFTASGPFANGNGDPLGFSLDGLELSVDGVIRGGFPGSSNTAIAIDRNVGLGLISGPDDRSFEVSGGVPSPDGQDAAREELRFRFDAPVAIASVVFGSLQGEDGARLRGINLLGGVDTIFNSSARNRIPDLSGTGSIFTWTSQDLQSLYSEFLISDGNNSDDFYIRSVSVIAQNVHQNVAAPATLALLGVGLVGMAGLRRSDTATARLCTQLKKQEKDKGDQPSPRMPARL